MSTPSFTFRRIAGDAHDGLVLTPILMTYLHDADYPADFMVRFRNHGDERRPDDWFHPSTHPLMTERQLYLYLTAPDKILAEVKEFAGALSITFGVAVHGFIQMCLSPAGADVLVPPPASQCVVCHQPTGWGIDDCNEHGVADLRTKARGHLDGVLNIKSWGVGGFEFKTSNLMKLHNVKNGDVAAFRAKWPEYYAQVQDYMRISGLRRFIVFFLGLGFPWTTREFVVEYDLAYALQLEQKYLAVRRYVEQGALPPPCCAANSPIARACLARMACPVGLA